MSIYVVIVMVSLCLADGVYGDSQRFNRISSQKLTILFQNTFYLKSVATRSLLLCSDLCMNNFQCATMIYEKATCSLYSVIPKITELESSPGNDIFMSI